MLDLSSSLTYIDGQAAAAREKLIAWAQINTGSGNPAGVARLAENLRQEFAALRPQSCQLIGLPSWQRVNSRGELEDVAVGPALQVIHQRTRALRVLLVIHMDTVYGPDHDFQQVQAQLEQGTGREILRGPGICDAKAGIAIMLLALSALEQSPLAGQVSWEVILNPDEELGSPSSTAMLAQAAGRADVGLLFEPTLGDGSFVSRRKGSGHFTLVFRGQSAHVGRDFARGVSAIAGLAQAVGGVLEISRSLPGVIVNIGQVEGGGAVNVVPDLAIARGNLRYERPEERPLIERALHAVVQQVQRDRPGLSVSLHLGPWAPPKLLDEPTQGLLELLEKAAADAGLPRPGFAATGGVSDGNRLAAAGLPCLDTLGGEGGLIHSPGEFLFSDSIAQRAKLALLLLARLAAAGHSGGNAAAPETTE